MNLFKQDVAMRFLQISIVVFQLLIDLISTRLIELQPNLIEHMHMQINALNTRIVSKILLEIGHHLPADVVFSIGFEHSEGEDVGVGLLLVVLDTHGVGADYDVVVVREF